MRYLLDTNVCVRYLNGLDTIRRRLRAVNLEEVAVCSVVKAELFYGAMRSADPDLAWTRAQRFLRVFESLPFDDIAGLTAGRIRVLAINGTPIGQIQLI